MSLTMYRLVIALTGLGLLILAGTVIALNGSATTRLPVLVFAIVFLGGYVPAVALLIRNRQRWVQPDDGTAWSWWTAGAFTLSISIFATIVLRVALG